MLFPIKREFIFFVSKRNLLKYNTLTENVTNHCVISYQKP